jgi:aspartate aminotransferase
VLKRSPTLAINEKIAARRAAGDRVLHLGFGEAGLPVPPSVAQVLAEAVGRTDYGPVAGAPDVRHAAAGYLTRRDVPTEAEQVVLAPGSKALLYAALAAVPGDLVLPVPSWVSYAAQASLTGKRVVPVPIPPWGGGIPDPEVLEPALVSACADGLEPAILILTLPDNPTGTSAGAETLTRVCEIADRWGLVIISDEIYRDLAYDPSTHLSPAVLLPERTIVTGGLSKNMALGGWRIGFARTPVGRFGSELNERIVGIGSEVWSSLAMPMQQVAAFVLNEPQVVTDHVAAGRRLHASVSGAVCRLLIDAGAVCRMPTAAFYSYPDFSPLAPALAARGISDGAALADYLLDEHGVAVLAGEHFGDDPTAYRLRVATSLLYGDSVDQRWEALRSSTPTELSWITKTLDDLRGVLDKLR